MGWRPSLSKPRTKTSPGLVWSHQITVAPLRLSVWDTVEWIGGLLSDSRPVITLRVPHNPEAVALTGSAAIGASDRGVPAAGSTGRYSLAEVGDGPRWTNTAAPRLHLSAMAPHVPD